MVGSPPPSLQPVAVRGVRRRGREGLGPDERVPGYTEVFPLGCTMPMLTLSEVPFSPAGSPLSPRAAAVLKQEIEQERVELMAHKGLAEGERDQAQAELQRREKELLRAQ